MNPLHDEMIKRYEQAVKTNVDHNDDAFKLMYHIKPPMGWLNDPNGLCFAEGVYHVYYQYSPYDITGGLKYWGHYTSKDLVHFKDEGLAILPDQPFDLHGVYSGSTYVEDDVIYYFYTGNVKLEGAHDYILSGRQQNTILAISKDGGKTIAEKKVVIDAADYPASLSTHVRDPKIRKVSEHDYFMILGARDKSSRGLTILYRSNNLHDWHYHDVYLGPIDQMGYMWECPDFFELDGKEVLLISPQGVEKKGLDYQNVYQSGYYLGELVKEKMTFNGLDAFVSLDYGFDFYAPQTFVDEAGNRVLIGWMGMPDAPYTNPKESTWQHALTLPRVLTVEEGDLRQRPHPNYRKLRDVLKVKKINLRTDIKACFNGKTKEFLFTFTDVLNVSLKIRNALTLSYEERTKMLTLSFIDHKGYGRDQRQLKLEKLTQIHCFIDHSSVEFFINDGMHVLTTRMYPDVQDEELELTGVASVEVNEWHLSKTANN